MINNTSNDTLAERVKNVVDDVNELKLDVKEIKEDILPDLATKSDVAALATEVRVLVVNVAKREALDVERDTREKERLGIVKSIIKHPLAQFLLIALVMKVLTLWNITVPDHVIQDAINPQVSAQDHAPAHSSLTVDDAGPEDGVTP